MANEYLKRTPTSTGNRKVFTWSGWVKQSTNSSTLLFTASPVKDNNTQIRLLSNGQIDFFDRQGSDPTTERVLWDPIFRDYSSWMHILINADTTKGTASDRVKCYVNGIELSRNAAGTLLNNSAAVDTPPQNQNFWRLNGSGYVHYIGANLDNTLDSPNKNQFADVFYIDGQQLGPEVFGFYKDGNGYISAGSTQSTDFRNGQWVPRTPREIKNLINDNGGFGVNGFYLPMNDSSNFGADFHTTPNSIIKLQEDLPQPKVSITSTAQAGLGYTDVLRADPYAANLVLAIPFVNSGLCTDGTNSGISTGFGDYSHIINTSQTAKDVQLITYNGTTPTIVSYASSSTNYYGSACYIDGNGSSHTGGHIRVVDDNIFDDLNLTTANWTIEGWFNPASRSTGGSNLFNFGTASDYTQVQVLLDPSGDIWHLWSYGGTWDVNDSSTTTRPPLNQWSHIAFEKVGTATTSYITTYVNGVAAKVTAVPQNIQYSSNPRLIIGGHYVSGGSGGDTYYYDGLVSDVRMYNVAKYKGGFDVPKPYTPVGISTWRAVPDTCQNNFATWNPLDVYQNAGAGGPATLSGGNLITGSNDNKSTHSNFGVTSGKWYYESIFSEGTNNSDGLGVVAQYEKGYNGTSNGGYYILYRDNGGLFIGNGTSRYDPPAGTYRSWGPNDVISVGIDVDNREVIFFNKGVEELRYPFPSHVADGAVWMPAILNRQAGYIYTNFGQNPTFSGNTTAGTYTDSNGKGLFKYQPPSGFLALCEDNLPTPTIKDPGEHFKTVLWTGDGADGRSITGVGFKPDFVWIKNRANGVANSWHSLSNSVTPGRLFSNEDNPEDSFKDVGSFDTDGMTINYGSYVNTSGGTYVAWCWKAGGPAVTNTDGSIISQVSANQTAGFSIVSYTGNGTAGATVGHGLEKAPAFIISKNRDATSSWPIYHKSTSNSGDSATDVIYLNLSTTGSSDNIRNVNDTTFSTTSWGGINGNGGRHIAYCWAEIEGFSKFGSYIGNLNADGPFVYCGFKPAFVLIKEISGTDNWAIKSNHISTNPNDFTLLADTDNTEYGPNNTAIDLVSNGFKIRTTSGLVNGSAATYIFAAFAESPYKYANSK